MLQNLEKVRFVLERKIFSVSVGEVKNFWTGALKDNNWHHLFFSSIDSSELEEGGLFKNKFLIKQKLSSPSFRQT